ncbi:protein PMR5 [Phalaenopsis equestris]|uniref:protein PMR5 n=1 Tax=Phalaenopsis equestris TaxID=78828 RepID=UPI0009E5DB96|nr:protein PMR5 [Phalaenopsis equestris]
MAHPLPSATLLLSLLYSAATLPINLPLCNLFSGQWLPDSSFPLYQYSSCPIIDPEFNCQLYGRPDSDYLRYRWKPAACKLPAFNGTDFLVKMRGKTVMFVGDSLGRNQWESLICMLAAAVPLSAAVMLRGDPLSTYKFLEYEVSVAFYRAPYLVDIDSVNGIRILRLDSIDKNGEAWKEADVLSFNSGHWWTHTAALQGWDYMGEDGAYYRDMDRVLAFEKGMSTWANWVDANVNTTRTRVFFQSLSPTHYNPMEWKDPISRNCYGETTPVSGSNYTSNSSAEKSMLQVLRGVLISMRMPAYFLDITRLSELRKDGHPSIYSGDLTPQQRANPDRSSDCSHWCLPGLPDTWNEIFYAALSFFF